jgi:hypothetical protein
MKHITIKKSSLPENSYLKEILEEKLGLYLYHKEQMELHERLMKKAEDDLIKEYEGYKKEYEDIKQFLVGHPERNQRIREFGHRMPIVENIN